MLNLGHFVGTNLQMCFSLLSIHHCAQCQLGLFVSTELLPALFVVCVAVHCCLILCRPNRPRRVPSSRYGRGNVIQPSVVEGRPRPPPPSFAAPPPPTSPSFSGREMPPTEAYEVVDVDERRRSLTISTPFAIEEELSKHQVMEDMIPEGDDYEPVDFDPEEIRRSVQENGTHMLLVPSQQGGDSASISSGSSSSVQLSSGSTIPSQAEGIYTFDSLSGSNPSLTQGRPVPVESMYSTELDKRTGAVAAESASAREQTPNDSANDVYGFDRLNQPAQTSAPAPAAQQESVYSFDRLDQERESAYGFDRLDQPTTQESAYGFDHLSADGGQGAGTNQEESVYAFDTLDHASTSNNPGPPPSLPPRPKPSTPVTPVRPAPPPPQVTPSNY